MNLLAVGIFMWIIDLTTIQLSANACKDGDVRLRGGRHYREGRVEVCRNQQWGRVCDDDWDENDSAVVCRQLGLSGEDAKAVTRSDMQFGTNILPFFLDDLGCTGSESNLLDCLPQHNCRTSDPESAGVRCSLTGVKLEYYGTTETSNNTLITVDDIEVALVCSTDREDCCTDEFNIAGSWFLPNGLNITSDSDLSVTNPRSLYITLGNQTVRLNIRDSRELPTGIYHCEIMDKKNVIHYLYAGIYPVNEGNVTSISVQYDRASQTITCTSSGGPATDVTWFKDNEMISIVYDEDLFECSQIIIDTIKATYENRLKIIDKSSKTAGTYICEVTNPRGSINESLYIHVCRDLELRVVNKSNGHGRIVEVCIDDQWHEARSAKVENNSQSLRIISIQVDSTSMMIVWSEQSNKTISGYDLSCKTSALSDGQIHEVQVPNVSALTTTKFQVSGLLPGTAYECCVSAHIQTNIPLDLISSNCATTKTKSLQRPSNGLVIGLGMSLGICSLLLALGVLMGFILSKTRCLKCNSTVQANTSKRDTEEYNLVANPIYNISMQRTASNSQQQMFTTTTTPARGDGVVSYEEVCNLHGNC